MSECLNVYEAINQVQLAMSRDGIGKSRKNEQQGYSFRGIDDMYNALSIPLASFGLCIIPRFRNRTLTERITQKGGTLFYVTVEGEFDLVGPDGSKHTAVAFGEAMDSGDKATNKAMSAAYKYMCMQLFCIPTEGDNDADATTHELKARADAVAQRKIKELTIESKGTGYVALPDPRAPQADPQDLSYEQRHTALILESNQVLDEVQQAPTGGGNTTHTTSYSAKGGGVEKPTRTRKKGTIPFDDLKIFGNAKTALRELVGDDSQYYDMLKLKGVGHANELKAEDVSPMRALMAERYKQLKKEKEEKDLLIEAQGHAVRIGRFATQATLQRHGLTAVEDILNADGTTLTALLAELRGTV